MRKKTTIVWPFGRGLSSLVAVALVHSLLLDGPLKAVSDSLERTCGPAISIGFLLAYGMVVYYAVYISVIPRLLRYVYGESVLVGKSNGMSEIQTLRITFLGYMNKAIQAYKERKSRSQLLADILVLRDTLTEHRQFSKRQRRNLARLNCRHTSIVSSYKRLKSDLEVEQVRYGHVLSSLEEANEENLALELRVFSLTDDLATMERLLQTERHERTELEGRLETEKLGRAGLNGLLQVEKRSRLAQEDLLNAETDKCSELEERLKAETREHYELEILIKNAYKEVAHSAGLRLNNDTMSVSQKLTKMLLQFNRQQREAKALQGTLDAAHSDVCARGTLASQLEKEKRALIRAAEDKDAMIVELNIDKERLLGANAREAVKVIKLLSREDDLISDRDCAKMEAARLREENDELRRAGLDKDQQIENMGRQITDLHGYTDVLMDVLRDEKIENLEMDTKMDALQYKVHSLQNNVVDKNATIATLNSQISTLQTSYSALQVSHTALQDSCAALQGSYTALQDSCTALQDSNASLQNSNTSLQNSIDAFWGSIDFANLEYSVNNKTIATLQDRVHGLRNDVLEKDEAIITLKNQNVTLQKSIDAFHGAFDLANLKYLAKIKVIATLENQIRGLQDDAVGKDEIIITLRNENTTLQNSVDAFYGSIDFANLEGLVKDEMIAKLEGENRAKDEQISVLENKVKAFRGNARLGSPVVRRP
ncbi:uncharacterized protein B0H18DRAFT_1212297 [Fomitopsis serialis]|uniref:uncharacterized protein n=1 Tax=Fomitopsis serialis TaxID=139415 RepID=UPI0020083237|nr:uncharacterized protein B0H18DRAFT_1212297 [Neoantrodia serialis]KAH9923263.1 hypothetical protein B0H18DRAFT_1212297 [Neoantrodia serialis]